MMRNGYFLCLLFFFLTSSLAWSQKSSLRVKSIPSTNQTLTLDSLSILPSSFQVRCGQQILTFADFSIDYTNSRFTLKKECGDSLYFVFRVLNTNFSKPLFVRDTSFIYNQNKGNREDFLITPTNDPLELMGVSGLKKSGSISRGIAFGNRQDLSVNSSLNLELSGYVAPNLQVLASITDDNLPIQPEGNTNKLQEFDQVFIQLFNDRFKLIAGDFWLSKPEGYFMTYKKRGQGLTGEYYWVKEKNRTLKTQVSGALSKGKFNRQIIQGIEGNQGPYRLRGNENEPFIIVLSGTERVYIDGRLLTRGQENDYIIDYNTSELRFTARNLITKDVRIVVEFQYSDQNYARSLFQFSTSATSKNFDWWINAYSEQDAKNQPLQQNLTNDQKLLMSQIGDSIELARTVVIDSTGFSENLVMYQLVDSLGFDSVLVASVNPAVAVYKVNFSYVGVGGGDYVFDKFTALGKVYRWVQPIGGNSVGDYAPVSVLITPKKQQLFTAGATYRLKEKWTFTAELGRSGYDLNTFSSLDRFDDVGYSMRSKIEYTQPFGKDSVKNWEWKSKFELEMLDPYFKPIEQYRLVEFDRDWNVRDQSYSGNQVYSMLSTGLQHRKFGNFNVSGQQFKFGDDFDGLRTMAQANWRQNGFQIVGDASFLNSNAQNSNTFFRHKIDISKQFNKFKFGYKDDQEQNKFVEGDSLLTKRSYSFFDYQGYVSYGDTTSGELRLSYRERVDGLSDSTRLKQVAKARTISGEWLKKDWKNQRLLVVANYRVLEIKDTVLMTQKPENSTNGRIDHEWKLWKNAVNLTTFYEVGAGLEQKRTFIYIKVNDGQGVYTWIDYNGDNIKDLNEFEIAAYADQASYIRVFTPSNEYTKTYSNEYNQTLAIRPERIWSSSKGIKQFISRFSTQSRFRIQRKTANFDGINSYNPFVTRVEDSSLISTSSNQKHSFYFNRTSAVFGIDYSYQQVTSKVQLATGFDGRTNESHELNGRVNIKKEWSILANYERGTKNSFVDYTTGRNFKLNYWQTKNSLVFQPTTSLRFSIDGRFSTKKNAVDFGGEIAKIQDLGITAKFNQTQKGSLQGQFNYIQMQFNGDPNTPLGFELLEALKPGKNFVWSLGYQRTLSKNLQISIQYNGRQSEGAKTIHAGGMEVRAFF